MIEEAGRGKEEEERGFSPLPFSSSHTLSFPPTSRRMIDSSSDHFNSSFSSSLPPLPPPPPPPLPFPPKIDVYFDNMIFGKLA
ncbi:unnamed protein product [Onchocerca flexuosa]|uniref:Uncharacterized protein n=1 Tax=Onchocerca flexuosa TaxID=387005 RepID=A0A183I7Q0_9BILA|nr:unnamed protein product [Onchocerca flexuosa]